MYKKIIQDIRKKSDKNRARINAYFFKTGKGEYGEGDKFWGLRTPESRAVAKKYINSSFSDIKKLLENEIHEVRSVALFILVEKYKKEKTKKKIFDFYLANKKYINNWDLVDISAHHIVGEYLINQKNKKVLLDLAQSKKLWEERIAMVATFAFIRNGELEWTFKLAKVFLNHEHDLMHKATGWMLREAGKKDEKALRKFLDVHIKKMPRTMLRYAIERFPEKIRKEYLKK